MSQSLLYHAFGVREGYEYVKTGYVEGRVEFHLAVKEEKLVCPECGAGPAMRRGRRCGGAGAGGASVGCPSGSRKWCRFGRLKALS